MPLFLIEFYGDLEGYIRKEADMIAGANSLDELIKCIDEKADKYKVAKVFILRGGHYIRILTADLREWRDIINEERQQKDNDSLHK